MSNVYGDELLGMILPIVEQRLRVADPIASTHLSLRGARKVMCPFGQ